MMIPVWIERPSGVREVISVEQEFPIGHLLDEGVKFPRIWMKIDEEGRLTKVEE